MAIEIPDDWPVRGWAEDSPITWIETLASNAPSGDVKTWKVSSWESTREIASAALPGQARHRNGLSVGTGKALVKREDQDFPWKQRDVYDLSGSTAQVLLAPEGSTPVPTGQYRVAEISGDLTTLGVDLELEERHIEGKDQSPGVLGAQLVSWEQLRNSVGDPIWVVAELAQQMGYGNGGLVPGVDNYDPILDIPFQGSINPAWPLGIDNSTSDSIGYSTYGDEGIVGLSNVNDTSVSIEYSVNRTMPKQFVWTLDADDGAAHLRWVANDESLPYFRVEVNPELGGTNLDVLIQSRGANGTSNSNTFAPGTGYDLTRNPDAPYRIQVEVTLSDNGTDFTSASVRVRRDPSDPWTDPLVHTMTNTIPRSTPFNIIPVLNIFPPANSFMAHYSVIDTNSNPQEVIDRLASVNSGPQGRIYLMPLEGTLKSPWLDPDLSVWSAMQNLVEAWQGAIITDVYGDLHVLNRNVLVGLNDLQGERVVDVGLNYEDIPWKMDYSDQADRLVVKYNPIVLHDWEGPPDAIEIIYEFQDVLVAWPGVNEYFFTLDKQYPVDLKLIPFAQKGSAAANSQQFHEWDAYRYNNGTGAHMDPNTDVSMRIDRVTSSTWKVYVVNRTASPFHFVDSAGTPWLKIRSSYYYDQTQEATVERGLDSGDARNELVVEAGTYVQSEEDANALADFLWSRVNTRWWKADTIVSVPDYRLDLGDVIEIRHERTGIKSNALVTKVVMGGQFGSVTQKIDLVLLPPTWEDFDEAWANAEGTGELGLATWDDFDALWADYTWDDFDRTPTATTVEEIEEGM